MLLAWAGVLALVDARQRRIPNALLLPVLVAMPASLLLTGSGPLNQGPWDTAAGFAAGALPTLPAYAFGRLGAGDVKLAAVLGGLLGPIGFAAAFLVASLALCGHSLWRGSRHGVGTVPMAPSLFIGFAAVLLAAGIAGG